MKNDIKKLGNIEASRHQMVDYGCAMRELAEGLNAHSVLDIFHHIDSAERYLTQFRGQFIEIPSLTDEDVELARSLHTYMRKCMDSHLSVMLYRMVAEDRGSPIWYAFVKGLVANNKDFDLAAECARKAHQTNESTDNLLMLHAILMWGYEEDFSEVIKWTEQ